MLHIWAPKNFSWWIITFCHILATNARKRLENAMKSWLYNQHSHKPLWECGCIFGFNATSARWIKYAVVYLRSYPRISLSWHLLISLQDLGVSLNHHVRPQVSHWYHFPRFSFPNFPSPKFPVETVLTRLVSSSVWGGGPDTYYYLPLVWQINFFNSPLNALRLWFAASPVKSVCLP
jgi:hypothetical protein